MTGEYTLKEALDKFVDYYKLRAKFDEKKVDIIWGEIVGPALAGHTEKIELKEKKLYVKVVDSVVRQELNFMKSRIKEVINRKFRSEIVEEVVVL